MVTISDPTFEGPFGLLLELVETGKLNVETVSVASITAAYLERVRELSYTTPDELSEFVQLGCRLLYIKSLSLLPREAQAVQANELQQLNRDLDEYRVYRLAARDFSRRLAAGSWHRQEVAKLSPHELPDPQLSIEVLANIFAQAIAKTTRPTERVQSVPRVSQEQMAQRLRERLEKGSFKLQELLVEVTTQGEVILLFCALLELLKANNVRITQAQAFGPIIISPTDPTETKKDELSYVTDLISPRRPVQHMGELVSNG